MVSCRQLLKDSHDNPKGSSFDDAQEQTPETVQNHHDCVGYRRYCLSDSEDILSTSNWAYGTLDTLTLLGALPSILSAFTPATR
jgi:hypothetical protein